MCDKIRSNNNSVIEVYGRAVMMGISIEKERDRLGTVRMNAKGRDEERKDPPSVQ